MGENQNSHSGRKGRKPSNRRASQELSSCRSALRPIDSALEYGRISDMAITTIRSTYALRIETVRQLNLLAERWGVSKSEALRRAIGEAALRTATDVHLTPFEAAASAILAGAPLLTKNLADFRIFEPFGLHLQR